MTATRPLLPRAPYDTLRDGFQWNIPERLNMATRVCDAWAARAPDRVAIRDLSGDAPQEITHAALREMADGLGFVDALPTTVTGKVIRKDLNARAAAEAGQ